MSKYTSPASKEKILSILVTAFYDLENERKVAMEGDFRDQCRWEGKYMELIAILRAVEVYEKEDE